MAKGQPEIATPSEYMPLVEQQAKYNRGNVTAGGFGTRTMTPTGDTTFAFDPSLTDTDALSKAMYERQMSLLRPDLERRQSSLEQSLANRGLPSGSEAYSAEMGGFQRNRDLTMQNIARNALIGGEQARGQRMQQAMGILGYSPTPVDVMGPAAMAQDVRNQQAQQQANAKGGATGLAGTALML